MALCPSTAAREGGNFHYECLLLNCSVVRTRLLRSQIETGNKYQVRGIQLCKNFMEKLTALRNVKVECRFLCFHKLENNLKSYISETATNIRLMVRRY